MVSGKIPKPLTLPLLTETWKRSVYFFGESRVVALDISKVFDRVWHQSLISKTKSYGVSNTFIRCLSDFLCNRSIRVVIDGIKSNQYPANSEVQQGSVISPTLFLLILNNLFCLTTNPFCSFTDDSSVCHSYSYNTNPNFNEVGTNVLTQLNLTLARSIAVCSRTSKCPILAQTFLWVVWRLQVRRLLMLRHIDKVRSAMG